jgi:hypothetical protein
MAVENYKEELERKKLDCAKKTSCVLQLQWDWYKSVARERLENA